MPIHSFDLNRFNFPDGISKILNVPDLAFLHEFYQVSGSRKTDQEGDVFRSFYDRNDHIRDQYLEFLRSVILPLFDADLCVQRVPTFRVSMPGGTAVREFHRDSDYNHQSGTINFWLPVTSAFDTNTVWVESEPDRGDFRPVNLNPGQMFEFDGTRLRHGNQSNRTGRTRVSLDFRVIPLTRYRPTGLATLSSGTPLELGGYYELMTKDGSIQQRSHSADSKIRHGSAVDFGNTRPA